MNAAPPTFAVGAAIATVLAVLLAVGGRGGPCASPSDRRDAERAQPCDELDLVDVVERVARDVRSGVGVRPALEVALDAAPSLLPAVRDAMRANRPLVDALAVHTPGGDERDVVVHALQLAATNTHVAGRVLDRAAVVVRERRAWRSERLVQSAQARTSARVLTLLPVGFALWGIGTSASVRDAVTGSSVAITLAVIGAGLNLAGWWWMRRIVRGPR